MYLRAIFLGCILCLASCSRAPEIPRVMCDGKPASMDDMIEIIQSRYNVDYVHTTAAQDEKEPNFEFQVIGDRPKEEIRKMGLESFALLLLTMNAGEQEVMKKPSVRFVFTEEDGGMPESPKIAETRVGDGLITYVMRGPSSDLFETETYEEARENIRNHKHIALEAPAE